MKVTLAQISPKLSCDNIQMHLDIINEHKSSSDVIVFPELSLHGYLLQDKVYENAYTLDDIAAIIEASKGVDIVVGMAFQDDKAIYNVGLYLSGGKVTHIHRKNHLPTYGMFEESRYFFKGENLESFETSFGESMLVVCEDLWRADIVSKIAEAKPKNLYVIANSPSRDFHDDGLLIQDQWMAILKTTALFSGTNVVFVNRTGFEDGLGFWGGSTLLRPDGSIIDSCQLLKPELKTIDISSEFFSANKMIMKHG
jgi:omega-amidase